MCKLAVNVHRLTKQKDASSSVLNSKHNDRIPSISLHRLPHDWRHHRRSNSRYNRPVIIRTLLRVHALQIRLQLVPLQDPELLEPSCRLCSTRCGCGRVRTAGCGDGGETDDAEGGVEGSEFFVLLEGVAQGVQSVLDQRGEVACSLSLAP